MKNQEENQAMENTAKQVETPLVKTYRIDRTPELGSDKWPQVWSESVLAVVNDSFSEDSGPFLNADDVAAMTPGDRLPLPTGSVYCGMVDKDWLAGLPANGRL